MQNERLKPRKKLIKQEINFNIVSKHSKISKATLYNNNKIRKRIEKLREQNKEIFVHKNKNDGKDALISSLKRRVNSLEKEKKILKEEISVLYSRIYEDI